jgi:alanyl-tRNA synthetase
MRAPIKKIFTFDPFKKNEERQIHQVQNLIWGEWTKELKENEEGMIITNQTSFYGESGGQVGDIGEIISGNFIFEVIDVQINLLTFFVHQSLQI